MINWIKKAGITLADYTNALHDPFDEFTRPILRKTQDTLAQKAATFDSLMKTEFMLPNGVYIYKKPHSGEALDLGDQALWHGIYTAMWSAKFKVTQDPADLQILRASLDSMGEHFKNGRLIRGLDPADGRIQDDASNDTLTGIVAGLYFAWIWGDNSAKSTAAGFMNILISELMTHGMCLVNQDGSETTYGRLIDGWKTDPLRLSLAIAALSVADLMLKTPGVAQLRRELLKQYGQIIGFPKVKLLWLEKKYDTHRAAMHLKIIRDLAEESWLKMRCAWGLKRIWTMERKAQDPWIAALCGIEYGELAQVAQRLHEYEVAEKGLEVERLNTVRKDYWKTFGVRFIVWDNKWHASQPLPFWMIGSQDFFPSRDLLSADNWQGQTDQRLRYNGGDFLASYWFHRELGTVGPHD